ncbi:unnamed protein product [Polarella glacialis]|uniref:Acetyl-CoA carboxylase n=1 Tax=Polarella glacialis TaxID=89957 RepID=A0A813GVM2_POLGL|nr:unnamed protein product [Polarella glacialis]
MLSSSTSSSVRHLGRRSRQVAASSARVVAVGGSLHLPGKQTLVPAGAPASASAAALSGIRHASNISAPLAPEPPFPTVIIYNQSKHACQSVLADIRAVWGDRVRVLQTLEDGLQTLPGMDGALYVKAKTWGDLKHFEQRLDFACSQDHALHNHRLNRQAVFMPGWSAFAESSEAAVAVDALGLVWPGTEPKASQTLEKIGFKRICEKVGKCVLEFMAKVAGMNTSNSGLIKSIHGGGGKGTAHLFHPDQPENARHAVEKVLTEMNRVDGIYFEQRVNMKGDGRFYQIELEVDGTTVAEGGRFVWFNSSLQKVVEIGLADDKVAMFMPAELYQKAREWSAAIAKDGNNNTRATMEALIFKNEKGVFECQFIECNRRPQVENEALALLQVDSKGNRRYTFAELMMRAKGYPAPQFEPSTDASVVLHARWLHGDPNSKGQITYQPGNILGMSGPRLDFVKAELLSPGEISFTSDPQLGKAVIIASSWEEMCDNAAVYFKLRKPMVMGAMSTYAQTMYNLFTCPKFRAGETASNETFTHIKIPEHPDRGVLSILRDQVSPIVVKGYRPGEGIDADRWPTGRVAKAVEDLSLTLAQQVPKATAFTKFARGEASYEDYVKELREQLGKQGGGWVTVAPRDTSQQGNDSESCAVSHLSRQNAEVWAERAGCVGYEIGGAQYQAGLIRGFDPAAILRLGLPYNMPAHSLQRSQYVNGLAELTPEIRRPLFQATADLVAGHYRPGGDAAASWVPWHPYNFHAGNFYDAATGYSPQDATTAELLDARCLPLPQLRFRTLRPVRVVARTGILSQRFPRLPMPNWVFSAKFPLEALEKWTGRQIDLFAKHEVTLHQIRIKNPGQGKDWTAEAVWSHVQTVAKVFKSRGLPPPIVYLHNHDFNGQGGHVAAELLKTAQKAGFDTLVIDAAYRKNGTHNDNTVLCSALKLEAQQREALAEYNHQQQSIEQILGRFDSRNSQMTPFDSDWAGGTEGSDIRIAKEYALDVRLINHAKEVASEVFPLERAVTPFSEYKLRLGIAIMIEPALQPKTVDAVKKWVNGGGKLKVGGDVLVGLMRWETLVAKPAEVDKLLANMPEELQSALNANSKLLGVGDLPDHFSTAQRHTALGYQQKGFDFALAQAKGTDLSPLLLAPHVLHGRPKALAPGTRFELLVDPDDTSRRAQVQFLGFGLAPGALSGPQSGARDLVLSYLHEGQVQQVQMPDPDAALGATAKSGPRKATPGNKLEFPTVVPGELLSYSVKVGDVLKKGKVLVVLESMKMEMKISVPDDLDGFVVKALPCKGRTKEDQGDILAPGDLMLELQEPSK